MAEIIRHPEVVERLDTEVLEALARHPDTRGQFFQIMANPLLTEIPTPEGIRVILDVDGEEQLNELHLHVECEDESPLIMIEIPELADLIGIELVDDEKKRAFFGIVAKAIQDAAQNGEIATPDSKKKNSSISRVDKERILKEIAESLIGRATK